MSPTALSEAHLDSLQILDQLNPQSRITLTACVPGKIRVQRCTSKAQGRGRQQMQCPCVSRPPMQAHWTSGGVANHTDTSLGMKDDIDK